MGIESAAGIWDLEVTWPLGTDDRSTSDDHHRLTKAAIKATFPNVSATVDVSAAELNHLSGADQNVQAALDTYSLSLSAINAELAVVSASRISINATLATHDDSISALNTTALLVKETYHVAADKDGTATTEPAGWSVNRLSSGTYQIIHGLGITDPFASAQYLGLSQLGFVQVNTAVTNSVTILISNATSAAVDSKFNLQMKLIP